MTSPKSAERKLVFVTALALIAAPVAAQASPPQGCPPNDNAKHPTMDGLVGNGIAGYTNDTGWDGASEIDLQDVQGTVMGKSVLKLKSDDSALYLGAVIQNGQIKAANTVVLGIQVRDGDTVVSSLKLVINPFTAAETGGAPYSGHNLFTNPAPTPTAPRYAKYWTNPSNWTTISGTDVPSMSWLGAQSDGKFGFVYAKDTDGTTNASMPGRWSFEVKIPRVATAADGPIAKGIYFAGGTKVLVYFNVLTTDTLLAPSTMLYEQYPWPSTLSISDGGASVETKMPDPTGWATLTLDSQCGISLDSNHIGVERGGTLPDWKLNDGLTGDTFAGKNCDTFTDTAIFVTNRLVAVPTSNQLGTVNVNAKFALTLFGIPGTDFTEVNQSAGTIDSGASTKLSYDWSLTKKEVCKLFQKVGHQCFRVNLTSTNATVLTPFVYRNLYWDTTSHFTDTAAIDTSGLPNPSSGNHRILLKVADEVLSDPDERELLAKGYRPSRCSGADPLGKSSFCECIGAQTKKILLSIDALNRRLSGELKEGERAQLEGERKKTLDQLGTPIEKECGGQVEKSSGDARGRRFQTLRRVVRAYAITEHGLNIRGALYQEAKYMGAYAYYLRHFIEGNNPDALDVGWLPSDLHADGLQMKREQPRDGGTGVLVRATPEARGVVSYANYVLDAPPGQKILVATVVDAKEGPKGSFGGNTVPPAGTICSCPAQGTTAALPMPKEVKLGSVLFLGVLGLRWRRRRRSS